MPIYEEKEKINGQKRWFIRTYIDLNGKKQQITRHNKEWLGRNGYLSAQQEEIRLKNKKINSYENLTLNGLAKMFFDNNKDKWKLSSNKKNNDNYYLYISPILGYINIFNLTNKDILDFHKCLDKKKIKVKNKDSKRGIGEHNISTRFKQDIHVTLVSILNFGCKYVGLNQNVASIVGNFKTPKGSIKKELNFLTKEEFETFIKYETNEIYKDFFILLFNTGMRKGELLAIEINDVDFDNNTITISKSINPRNGKEYTDPKTNRSNRKIKMINIVKNILCKYKGVAEVIFGLDKIKPTTLQRKCDNNCKYANINKNIRIHDFRHSFASMCIFKGVPIEIISEYLGHESISTTLNIYAHLYPNSQDKLVDILNKQDQKQD